MTTERSELGPDELEPAEPLNRIPRVLPDEFRTIVREERALEVAAPYFNKSVVDSIIDAVKAGLMHASITHHAPDGTVRTIDLSNPQGTLGEITIVLNGDWKETEKTRPGLLLEIGDYPEPTMLRLFRRLRPEDQPLIEVGKTVDPETGLIVAMRGKRVIEVLRLPTNRFPNGGIVTDIFVPDDSAGHQVTVSKDQPFAYARIDPLLLSTKK